MLTKRFSSGSLGGTRGGVGGRLLLFPLLLGPAASGISLSAATLGIPASPDIAQCLGVRLELVSAVRREALHAHDLVELLVVEKQNLLGREPAVVGRDLAVPEARLGPTDDVLEVQA